VCHHFSPALETGSDDPAANPQTEGANRHHHKTEITTATFIRDEAKCDAYTCDQDNQPVQPPKQRDKTNEGQNKGNEAQKERDKICRVLTVPVFGRRGK
jgi:hypothetical protein